MVDDLHVYISLHERSSECILDGHPIIIKWISTGVGYWTVYNFMAPLDHANIL